MLTIAKQEVRFVSECVSCRNVLDMMYQFQQVLISNPRSASRTLPHFYYTLRLPKTLYVLWNWSFVSSDVDMLKLPIRIQRYNETSNIHAETLSVFGSVMCSSFSSSSCFRGGLCLLMLLNTYHIKILPLADRVVVSTWREHGRMHPSRPFALGFCDVGCRHEGQANSNYFSAWHQGKRETYILLLPLAYPLPFAVP